MKEAEDPEPPKYHITAREISDLAFSLAATEARATPSHLYLELLRHGIREGWHLEELDLRTVTAALIGDGWSIEPKSGRLSRGFATVTLAATRTEPWPIRVGATLDMDTGALTLDSGVVSATGVPRLNEGPVRVRAGGAYPRTRRAAPAG